MTPEDKKQFVADPARGSRHNRGCAVDLTLYELKTGRQVSMPGDYDEMSERSHINYAGGTAEQRRLRDLLRAAMERRAFAPYEPESGIRFKEWLRTRSSTSLLGVGKLKQEPPTPSHQIVRPATLHRRADPSRVFTENVGPALLVIPLATGRALHRPRARAQPASALPRGRRLRPFRSAQSKHVRFDNEEVQFVSSLGASAHSSALHTFS